MKDINERHIRVLDVGVTLRGPGEIIEPLAFAYRRFSVEQPADDATVIEIDATDSEVATVGGRRMDLIPDLEIGLQLYQYLLNTLMDGIGTHALLHAAALRTRDGGALLLAAPSGHGKTSLTLELAHRGLGFLGDDYAPLDLDLRHVLPYPRAVGIVPEGAAPIPEPFRERARGRHAVNLFGKMLVDVGQVLGESSLVTGPVPLRRIVLLTSEEAAASRPPTRVVVVGRRGDADELDDFFTATEGIEILDRADRPQLSVWNLRLRHEASPTEALSAVLDGDKVVFAEKHWEAKPEFGGSPRATPLLRREAAEALGRELLNRRRGGKLLASHGNNLTALFVRLAGALRETSCWRVCVGDHRETADLVESLAD